MVYPDFIPVSSFARNPNARKLMKAAVSDEKPQIKKSPDSQPEPSAPSDESKEKKFEFQKNLFQTGFTDSFQAKLSPDFEKECLKYQENNGISEDRVIKLANKDAFVESHAEAKKRVSLASYPFSYGMLGGGAGFLLAKDSGGKPVKSAIIAGAAAAGLGLAVSYLVTPWVARAEARALTYADDVGIKSFSQLGSAHDTDGLGLPGGDLLAGALFGNLIFKS